MGRWTSKQTVKFPRVWSLESTGERVFLISSLCCSREVRLPFITCSTPLCYGSGLGCKGSDPSHCRPAPCRPSTETNDKIKIRSRRLTFYRSSVVSGVLTFRIQNNLSSASLCWLLSGSDWGDSVLSKSHALQFGLNAPGVSNSLSPLLVSCNISKINHPALQHKSEGKISAWTAENITNSH